MSFSLRLSNDTVAVDPGSTVPCVLEVTNATNERDRFELVVEGVDSEWVALPVPEFIVEPNETITEKLFFKPLRASDSLAGNYPFVVKLRSLVSGDAKTVQGILQVRPYHALSMDVMPRRCTVSALRRSTTVSTTIMNLGNTEHTVQLFGSDSDDDCVTEFEQEQVTLGPGQQKSIDIEVSSRSNRWLSGTRLEPFILSGRSTSTPGVLTSTQGQLEVKAFLTPATFIGFLAFLLVGGFWIYAIPKPPKVELFVDKTTARTNEPITLSWSSSFATAITLKMNGKDVMVVSTSGRRVFTPKEPGKYVFQATPVRDSKEGQPVSQSVEVEAPPPTPDPRIERLSIKGPSRVHVGQSVLLQYQITGAKRAYIGETGEVVDLNVNERQIVLKTPGDFTYTLIAEGEEGKVVKKTFKVKATDESLATITSFKADRTTLEVPGKVMLTWEIKDAASALLMVGTTKTEVPLTQNNLEVDITESTTITLRALDDQGRAVQKTIQIKLTPLMDPNASPDLSPTPANPEEKGI